MLLLIFTNQPAPAIAGFVNASTVINDIWPPLNARSEADAVFWTAAQMYEWFSEAAKRLASECGIFVVRDTSITVATGTATYNLPPEHEKTIQCDLAGAVLYPRSVQEIEALDSGWPATTGAVEAFLHDVEGVEKITLYRKPLVGDNGKAIGLVMRVIPDDVTPVLALLEASPFLSEYFTFSLLAEARSIETRAQMPEIAKWLRGLADMMRDAIRGYMGGV